MRAFATLSAVLLAGAAALPAHARTAPAANCLDARDIQLLRQVNSTTLLVATTRERYRVDLVNVCDGIGASETANLLSADGWACGTGNEYIRDGEQLCGIRAVTPIGLGEYSILARIGEGVSGEGDGETVLPTLEVEGKPRKHTGFAPSADYCVDPRHVTGWSYENEEILVNVAPRAGGARSYRLQLGRSCPEFGNSDGLQLRSGVGIQLICGNPGDVATPVAAAQAQGELMQSTFVTRIVECPIIAVFAVE